MLTGSGPSAPTTIEWVSQPPPKASSGRKARAADALVEKLKTRPEQWARVEEGVARATATALTKLLRFRGVETATRSHEGGVDVYARYVEPPTAY